MDVIIHSVDNSLSQMNGIATATEEQSAVSEEINKTLQDIGVIAKENLSMMKESNDNVQQLSSFTDELNEVVERMKSGN